LKILFLTPAPGNISPSQRFRFEQYINLEGFREHSWKIESFYDQNTWDVLHKNGHSFIKVFGIFLGFFRRFLTLFTLFSYDFVYIHREASPIGPPIFEWIIARVFRKKLIYDFDDTIWVKLASVANPWVASLKCSWKVARVCKMAHKVSVGNEFLAEFARKHQPNVTICPTVVNTTTYHNQIKDQFQGEVIIGWTGTYTNLHNLQLVNDVIGKLQQKYPIKFLIICNRDPKLTGVNYFFKKWEITSEIYDLMQIHIGIMPLASSDLEKGKCGFKAIQYNSLGIPAVVSPVGANVKVINHEMNGFLASTPDDWYIYLEKLINDSSLRAQLGLAGRKNIIDHFSVQANQHIFLSLFK
jgi:glycosyltransferase involved in cell wall biosynthesis